MGEKRWNNVCTQVNTCAMSGAAAFFAGIPDATIVANGPVWCYFYALRHLEKSCPTIGERFFCSQPDNNAVVYGTEECLLDILRSIKKNSNPSVILIENSCAISLIGDDIAGIARRAEMSCPVVVFESGGLIGGFWEGYRLASQAYFDTIAIKKRSLVETLTVNLLGCTIGYYNAANDLRELKRMLSQVGCRVVACPGAGSSSEEISTMTRAELNIVVHEELGLALAQRLEAEYNMPYISLLPPYGIEGSLQWLTALRQSMNMDRKSWQSVQREASELERYVSNATLELQQLWGELWFERTLVAGPSSVALGMAQAVRHEWADTGPLTVVMHDGKVFCDIPENIDMILAGDSDSLVIESQVGELTGGLLLGSSNEKAILQQKAVLDVICQNIALPVYDELIISDRPFMGLRGACYMTENLWNQYIIFCQRWR